MPAPAVIPAPIAYIKIVAVKKLVVELLVWRARPVAATQCVPLCACHPSGVWVCPSLGLHLGVKIFYFEKIRVFKAGLRNEYISME